MFGMGLDFMASNLDIRPPASLFSLLDGFCDGSYSRRSQAEQVGLLLSASSSDMLSSDERDKLYALLGLIKDSGQTEALFPNYSKPIDQFYQDLAVYFVNHGYTDFLAVVRSRGAGLPSWVPLWNADCGEFFLNKKKTKAIGMRLSYDQKALHIDAISLGPVLLVQPFDPDIAESVETFLQWLGDLDRSISSMNDILPDWSTDTATRNLQSAILRRLESLSEMNHHVCTLRKVMEGKEEFSGEIQGYSLRDVNTALQALRAVWLLDDCEYDPYRIYYLAQISVKFKPYFKRLLRRHFYLFELDLSHTT
jgi:hypothetical protein